MKIFVTSPKGYTKDTFFTEKSKKYLETLGEVSYNPYDRQLTKEELSEYLRDTDICITGWGAPKFDEITLKNANKLKFLAHTGGTVAPLVSDALYAKGVTVMSGNPVFAESVAESCICYIMCSLRRIEKYQNMVREGSWRDENFFNQGIMDRTIGLVGFGTIAQKLVKMLQPFRVNIKVYSGHLKQEEADKYGVKVVPLDEIFETCDIISIHSAKTPKTFHMVNKEQLSKMKDGALLVNTARGAVIDEEALTKELETGRILAALDVFEEEPLAKDSKLRNLENVLVIPHMGGPTIDRREYVVIELVNYIKHCMDGHPELAEGVISADYAKNMTR